MTSKIKPKREGTAKSKAHYRKYMQARYKENHRRMQELKARPCMDCGQTYPPYVMDWDHRDPATKKYCIGSMSWSTKGWDTILEEIAKCDLVCANCHRIRTYKGSH